MTLALKNVLNVARIKKASPLTAQTLDRPTVQGEVLLHRPTVQGVSLLYRPTVL